MATIQSKITNGQKYWYIVESRRVNGKPRPVVLEYLGKAETLLKRLNGIDDNIKLKSYSHGLVSSLLNIAKDLDMCSVINKHCKSSKEYIAEKPIRNGLTAGATIMLAAIERTCSSTSKNKWSKWAKTTSLEYLLRFNFSKVDSQHFWDMMDCIPESSISLIEEEIIKKVVSKYDIMSDTLFFDTTNYYTYINTTNDLCNIAQRGKNKQKRNDLRQIGLALAVTRKDMIPIFHSSYEGNINDSKVFAEVIKKIKERLSAIGLDERKHTIVFDRGNNSKRNLNLVVNELGLCYVGALTPYHHKELIEEASVNLKTMKINEIYMEAYRTRRDIWGHDMTLVILVSDKLKEGQIRGIYTSISKCEKEIIKQNELFRNKKSSLNKEKTEEKIYNLLSQQGMCSIINTSVVNNTDGTSKIDHSINYSILAQKEEEMGFKILMTNRHEWTTEEIVRAYNGQSHIENAFKNMKDPLHLSLNPQYHWTDQKIKVHNFYCVLSYLMSSIIYKIVREKTKFKGTLGTLLDELKDIRLGTLIESTGEKGKPKSIYRLEEMSDVQKALFAALELNDFHTKKININELSVYK